MNTIGERIVEIRINKKLSQNKLAKLAGIGQSTLSAIQNQSKNPSAETLQLLASALGVSVSFLLGQAQEKPAHEMSRQELLSQIDIKFSQLPQDLKAQAMAYVAGRLASRKEQ